MYLLYFVELLSCYSCLAQDAHKQGIIYLTSAVRVRNRYLYAASSHGRVLAAYFGFAETECSQSADELLAADRHVTPPQTWVSG